MNRKLLLLVSALGIATICKSQETQFRGFANVDFVANKEGSSFMIGQYDNFVTSQLTDRISFLSEVVFEYDEGFVLDVERVIIQYQASNYLNLKIGKIHNPIGYWNNAYHHGTLIQPTIQRPLPVKFEDEGGILPIHTVGLWLSGQSISDIKIGYDLVIGNGIGENSFVHDDNPFKSITFGLHFDPVKDLEMGVSSYFDKLGEGEFSLNGDVLSADMQQRIVAGHIAYLKYPFELIGEYHNISNETSLSKSSNNSMYIYAGYNIKKVTPYLRYDNITYDKNDPYFMKDDRTMYTVGLKYEFSYLANVKFEASSIKSEVNGTNNQATVSFAIGF